LWKPHLGTAQHQRIHVYSVTELFSLETIPFPVSLNYESLETVFLTGDRPGHGLLPIEEVTSNRSTNMSIFDD
jgi:hypothetical protein